MRRAFGEEYLVWSLAAAIAALLLAMPHPASALSVVDADFDQIAKITGTFGGTVTQIGGGAPGQNLLSSGDFVGPADALSGVTVTIPSYIFATQHFNFDAGGSSEPGNDPNHLLGAPTDITFTIPGPGGPDALCACGDDSGDGSIQFLSGGEAELLFNGLLTAPVGLVNDIFIFTNTAGGGDALIRLLGPTMQTIQSVVIPGGPAASGMGGLVLDIATPTGPVMFGGISWTVLSGGAAGPGSATVEIDAVAVIPEPSTSLLLGLGLGAVLALRRTRARV